jgi:geranylgeranyl diphosphate synthase type II
MLIRYKDIIDKELDVFSKKLPSISIYDPIKYIINNGGKRFRSSLTLFSTDLFSNNPLLSINEAIAIELFHNFTLIHDDIMDQAPLRRNQPSIHKKWNSNIAILSGDLLYAVVNSILSKSSSQSVETNILFQETAIQVCEGQSLDMEFEKSESVTIVDYIEMIQLKTAVLVACSLKMGSIIGGASKEDSNLLYDFGLYLGTAFQIHDDILDVFPNEDNFGKQVGGDIIEKKKTILFIDFLNKSTSKEQILVDQILRDNKLDNEIKVAKVKEYFIKYSVLKVAEDHKNKFYNKAIRSIKSLSISNKKKQLIEGFAIDLMNRKF